MQYGNRRTLRTTTGKKEVKTHLFEDNMKLNMSDPKNFQQGTPTTNKYFQQSNWIKESQESVALL